MLPINAFLKHGDECQFPKNGPNIRDDIQNNVYKHIQEIKNDEIKSKYIYFSHCYFQFRWIYFEKATLTLTFFFVW